jgi:hypothetical protein
MRAPPEHQFSSTLAFVPITELVKTDQRGSSRFLLQHSAGDAMACVANRLYRVIVLLRVNNERGPITLDEPYVPKHPNRM